ncbi:MAG: site-specific DNA-methyltransferase [Micrococcaceae bacterium]
MGLLVPVHENASLSTKGIHRVSRLTDLIRQAKAKDPALGADLEAEFSALAERRQFGLNFERHQPEAVELPGRPVRKGDKVRILPPRGSTSQGDQRLWRVTRVEASEGASVALLELPNQTAGEPVAAPLEDLVVVAEFRDTIYPGLVSTGRLERDGTMPFHTVINAENFHALRTLQYTHRGQVDVIYIDPPYNTGNDDWIYNDRHVSGDDLYRHSKWLAFMERRLKLARELLKNTGVIIVAIGDDEHHRLRMLMDQVFHESNFISNVVWQGGRKNDSRYVSNGADYMLIYAKNEPEMSAAGIRWREQKRGIDLAREAAKNIWRESNGDPEVATKAYSLFLKQHKPEMDSGVSRYNKIDEHGRLYSADGNLTWPGGGGPKYTFPHPVTRKPVAVPSGGWRYQEARMLEEIKAGRVAFGEDERKIPRGKAFLDDLETQVASSVFDSVRTRGGSHLYNHTGSGVFREKRFPNPKDHEVLMRWLRLAASKEATILDFFGGSGSTMEAVMRLNAEDGGIRQCILVTNNEVGAKEERKLRKAGLRRGDSEWEARGVYEYVTKPRITAVVTGERPDGSRYEDTVNANIELSVLSYESPWRIARGRSFDAIAPLLWLRAGARGRRIDAIPHKGWDVADVYGVIADLDATGPFLNDVAAAACVRVVFVVTDDDRAFQSVCAALPDGVEPVRLYESYLRNFEIKGQE